MKLLRLILTLCVFISLTMLMAPQLTVNAEIDPNRPYLVSDVFQGSDNSEPQGLVAFENQLFFIADDGIHGREWWSTDGKEDNTKLFLDLIPGTEGYFLYSVNQALAVNHQLFFPGYDPEHGSEMWVSDGTPGGTHMTTDLFPGTAKNDLWVIIAFKNEVYFTNGYYDCNHEGLWKTDGTESGTILIHTMNPEDDSCDAKYRSFSINNDTLFFGHEMLPSDSLYLKYEVSKTDGTVEGTALVWTRPTAYPGYYSMGSVNGLTFFAFGSSDPAIQIYQTDGNEEGTKNLYYASYPHFSVDLTAVGDWMYFAGIIDANYGIIKTQGVGKTEPVKYFDEANPYENRMAKNLLDFYGRLLFSVDNGDGQHLWISDGSESGTYELLGPSEYHDPEYMTAYQGKAYFAAEDDAHGRELWVADGTAEGTRLLADINPGIDSSNPEQFTVANGTLFFTADDGTHGIELWAYDAYPYKIFAPTILR